MSVTFTHAELVQRAERWLRNTRRCPVVLTEASGTGWEIPDAVGWTCGGLPMSTLVECKTSRADFRVDQTKPFRDQRFGDMAIGRFRYYMAPAGMLDPDEIPPRWGLLEVRPASVKQTVKATRWDLDTGGSNLGLRHEMEILLSELRKIQIAQSGREFDWKSRSVDRVKVLVGQMRPSPINPKEGIV